jgi:hypothetical protein
MGKKVSIVPIGNRTTTSRSSSPLPNHVPRYGYEITEVEEQMLTLIMWERSVFEIEQRKEARRGLGILFLILGLRRFRVVAVILAITEATECSRIVKVGNASTDRLINTNCIIFLCP